MRKWLLIICLLIEMASFGQVTLQTGAAEVGFPLFQFADAKSRLSASFGLSYMYGNGLRVNEPSSCFGTGWTMLGAGVITRIQHGEPDDQQFVNIVPSGDPLDHFKEQTVFGTNIDYYYPDGYLYTTTSPQNNMPAEVCYRPVFTNWFPRQYKANYDDREQDIFSFQFNGRAGQFVIGKNLVPQVLEDSKLKITFAAVGMSAQKIRTRISSFTITDETGIQYKFSELEIADALKTAKTNTLVNGFPNYQQVELNTNTIRKVVTRWFLSEIINPATNEKIIFAYDTYSLDFQGAKRVSGQINGSTHTKQILESRTKISTKRLTSVTFPDTHKIDFLYSSATRVDLPGDKALTTMKISYNGNLLYAYQFNYGYFFKHEIKAYNFSFQAADIRYARLCLTDFKKTAPDGSSLPPYVFTYNVPVEAEGPEHIVPPLYTINHDPWGYWNSLGGAISEDAAGYPNSITLGERYYYTIDIDRSKYGIIKTVQYPEGGILEYEYEMNKAESSPYANKYAGGVRVKRTKLYDGNSHLNDIIKDYKYVQANGTSSSAWGFETPKFTEPLTIRQYAMGGSVNEGTNAEEIATSVAMSFCEGANPLGGLAIIMIRESYNSMSNNELFKIILGFFMGNLIDLFYSGSPYKDISVTLSRSENMNLINPLPMQYNRVEVVEAANNSKVVYEFTDDVYNALRGPAPFASPFSSAKQRAAHWVYGLPRFVTWFNSTGQQVIKIENQYTAIVNEINTSDYLSRSWNANTVVAAAATGDGLDHASKFQSGFTTTETFYPIQGRMQLDKTIETIHNSTGGSTSTETVFTYSPNNFQVRTISKKDSKGNYTGATTYYVADYNIAGVINNMKTANMVNMPVSINKWVKGPLGTDNENLTDAMVTEYNTITSGDFRPYQIYQSELASPLAGSVADVDNFSATNFKNYSYLQHKATMLFTQGSISQQTAVSGNSNKSIIYDYNQRLPVAEVINAIQSRIAYTSFEADGSGGWIFSPSGVKTTYSITGKKSFDLTIGNIGLTNWFFSEPITISMWTTGSTIFVNRSFIGSSAVVQITPTKTGPTINGWKYCEFTFDMSEIDDFYISGNGLIDELRLHPANARMATCCYEPGVGKTVECDVSNRIIYYDYDKFGRLVAVRDQNRNLIKAYEYNYKQ